MRSLITYPHPEESIREDSTDIVRLSLVGGVRLKGIK